MEIRFSPRHYAYVHPLLWPLVFLRLWRLYWWSRIVQRDVIYDILPDGRVCIWFIGDDPRDLNGWRYRQSQTPKPHLDACHNAAGDLHLPDIVVLTHMAMQRSGYFVRWVWVRVVARAVPAVIDTS